MPDTEERRSIPLNTENMGFISPVGSVKALIEQSAITGIPSISGGKNRSCTLDKEAAREVLENFPGQELPRYTDEQIRQLAAETQATFEYIPAVFERWGISREQLRAPIRELMQSGGIKITDLHYSWFDYPGPIETLAKNKAPTKMHIGTGHLQLLRKSLATMLSSADVSVDPRTIDHAALSTIVGNGYGHAVNAVLELLQIKGKKGKKSDIHAAHRTVFEDMSGTLMRIAPDPEMDALFADEPPDGTYTDIRSPYSERVAAGFERVALQSALTEGGLSDKEVLSIMEQLGQKDIEMTRQLNELVMMAKERGIRFEDLGAALTSLSIYLMARNRENDLGIKLPRGFGSRMWGYHKPLTLRQLQVYVSQYLPLDASQLTLS